MIFGLKIRGQFAMGHQMEHRNFHAGLLFFHQPGISRCSVVAALPRRSRRSSHEMILELSSGLIMEVSRRPKRRQSSMTAGFLRREPLETVRSNEDAAWEYTPLP